MFGYGKENGQAVALNEGVVGEGSFTPDNVLRLIRKAAKGEPQVFEWLAQDKHGEKFWVEVNLKLADINGKERVIAVVRNIDERKAKENELKNEMYKDALTGLFNRSYFWKKIESLKASNGFRGILDI